MDVTGEFVLARDVALVDGPVMGGPGVGRRGQACEVAFLEDADAVLLLSRFRVPTTIGDALWDTAAEVRRHPEDMLECGYPLIRDLIDAGYIVAAGSDRARTGHRTAVGAGG